MNKSKDKGNGYVEAMAEWKQVLQEYTDAGGHLLAPMNYGDPTYIRSAAQTLRIETRKLEHQNEKNDAHG
jgi:hypothetical protein